MTQPLIFEGRVPVDYHQAYLLTGEADLMSQDFFVGQCNGLLGASVPGALILTTGTALGDVLVRLVVHEEEPPLDPRWEDVVEASLVPTEATARLVTWGGEEKCTLELARPSYRARWSGQGMDVNYDGHVEAGAEVDNVFELALWPAPVAADAVLRQDSDRGRQAHPPWDAAVHYAAELAQKWGANPPSEALRYRQRAWAVVQGDWQLAEDLAAAPVQRQRAVTVWALRRACRVTRLDRLEWVPQALQALTAGEPMPGPLQDPEYAVRFLEDQPLLRSLRRRPDLVGVFEATSQVVRALVSSGGLDSLDAVLEAVAVAMAADAVGGGDEQVLVRELRDQFGV